MNENPIPGATPTEEPAPSQQPIMEPVAPQAPEFTPNSNPTLETPIVTPIPEATPKKKTGLIIGILITVFIVCGGALAAFFLLGGKKDPETIVYNAFANLIENPHENTIFSGSISASATDMPLSYTLTIDAKTSKTAAEIDLGLNADTLTSEKFNAGASLIIKDKNIFAKIKGISELVEDYATGIDLSAIDDQWYQTDIDQISKIVSVTASPYISIDGEKYKFDEQETPEVTCITNELKSLTEKRDEFTNLYQSNKFMSVSEYTDSKITAKKDTLYEISTDKIKLIDFTNAFIGSNLLEGVFGCVGTSNRGLGAIDAKDFEEFEIPTIYVEVSKNEELTRIYLPVKFEASGLAIDISIDLSIDHPDKLEILEPANAINLNKIIETLIPTTNFLPEMNS